MKKIVFLIFSALTLIFALSCEEKNKPSDFNLTLTPSTPIQFDAAGGVKTIAVASDMASWEVASSQQWCLVAASSDGKSFTITAQANTETTPRAAATVTVTGKNGGISKTAQIAVTQLGMSEPQFVITVSNVSKTGVDLAVEPKSKTDTYYYDVIAKADLAEFHGNDLTTYISNMIAQATEYNDGDLAKALAAVVTVGDDTYSTTNLTPNIDYIVFAVGLDDQGKPSTAFVESSFKTLDNSVSMTFTVDVKAKYFNGFDYTVTPSDLTHPFYTTLRPAGKYKGMDNDALRDAIIVEDSFMIDYYAKAGISEYINEVDDEGEGFWNTGTTYIVIAFGWADGVATTPLMKFEITTEDVEVPAGANFAVVVDKITSRSANVTVTPSLDKAMYLFDLMDEATYNAHKNNMVAYVEDYVSEIYIELEQQLYREKAGYNYDKVLKSNSKYYVWTAYIDQFGAVRGNVGISDVFSTLEAQQSSATVTSAIEKYFNGDDLFAKDPVKYAELKGKAYVPITYQATQDANLWYCVMVEEDPADPTSAISDAEMAASLEAGAGIWCSIGKVYICNWDKDHTALGVAVGADQNYGPVMRDKYKFTKAGASPISEFVEPVAAPAAVSKKFSNPSSAKVKVYRTVKKK